jgi:hypothetical protein
MSYWYDTLKGSDELPFLVVWCLILKINRKKCGRNLHICRKSCNFAAEKRGMPGYYPDEIDVAWECPNIIRTERTLLGDCRDTIPTK